MKDSIDNQLWAQRTAFCKDKLRTGLVQIDSWYCDSLLNNQLSGTRHFTSTSLTEKALDSLYKRTLWELLRHYDIFLKIINIIRNLYDGIHCKLVHLEQLTDGFEVRFGGTWGCMLSSFFFLLVIDWIMKTSKSEVKHRIQWTGWMQEDEMDFAHDLTHLSHIHQKCRWKQTV